MVDIYVDGSGWNGKESKACIYVDKYVPEIIKIVISEEKTNNYMEYYALKYAIEKVAEDGDTIYIDSQLVYNQLFNNWKINYDHLKQLNQEILELLKTKKVNIVWVRREENKAGKVLEHGKT